MRIFSYLTSVNWELPPSTPCFKLQHVKKTNHVTKEPAPLLFFNRHLIHGVKIYKPSNIISQTMNRNKCYHLIYI